MPANVNYEKIKLGDVLEVLTDYHANGSYAKLKEKVTLLDKPDYAVMIRTTNFEKDDFEIDLKYISEDAYHFLSKTKVRPFDILMNKIANAGSVYLMPNLSRPVSLAMNLFLLRTKTNITDQRYVYYYLKSNQDYIKTFAIGTATTTITKEAVRNLDILLPEINIQQKVVSIITNYESLIENNMKRIRILEEMVQRIYQEWFVNLRFPGYESVDKLKSAFGPTPEGWNVITLKSIAEVFRGRSYKGSELTGQGGIPFLNLKCIERDGGFRFDGLKYYRGVSKENQKAVSGDIIMAVTDMTQERRLVARAARVPELGHNQYVFSMDVVKIMPKEKTVPKDYLYCMLRYSDFADKIKQYANGANVLHLSPSHIENFNFMLPPEALRYKFSNIVADILNLCDDLQYKNRLLKESRDLLIPRLISGEIDIGKIDISTLEEGKQID